MTNLLPCPGCGGEADPKEVCYTKPHETGDKPYYSPGCTNCGFTAPSNDIWNTRNFSPVVRKVQP